MKPMTEKQAIWWKKKRENGFFSYIKYGVIYAAFGFFLFLCGYFATEIPLLYLNLMTIIPTIGLPFGMMFDWWRYEKKYQLYLKNPLF